MDYPYPVRSILIEKFHENIIYGQAGLINQGPTETSGLDKSSPCTQIKPQLIGEGK
jgi:hypothetical protein